MAGQCDRLVLPPSSASPWVSPVVTAMFTSCLILGSLFSHVGPLLIFQLDLRRPSINSIKLVKLKSFQALKCISLHARSSSLCMGETLRIRHRTQRHTWCRWRIFCNCANLSKTEIGFTHHMWWQRVQTRVSISHHNYGRNQIENCVCKY